MSKIKTGNIDQSKTVKAGCGIRYDPEQLGEETGFDFSAASKLTQESETDEAEQAIEPNKTQAPKTTTNSPSKHQGNTD